MGEDLKNEKPSCFVIQAFDDGGQYDKRYAETIRPALLSAGVEPLRADQILGLQPVIQKIEDAIKSASICLAEVSTDNSNVWLELGYALALDRPVVILCDRHIRSRLPFDIQHRPVILYRTDSKSGYDELERNIVKFVKNELEKSTSISQISILRNGADVGDLTGADVAILASLLALWPASPEGASSFEVRKRLDLLGHNEIAFGLGVARLLQKNFIQRSTSADADSEWYVYHITQAGLEWLQQNEAKIESPRPPKKRSPQVEIQKFEDDDIPF